MPAINPARLADEVKELQNLVENPQRLCWRLMQILDFYADRTRRDRSSRPLGHADRKLGVPLPVMQALERGLKESVFALPGTASALSEEFWRVDYRETRYLAITLLEGRPLEELLRISEAWSLELKDMELIRKLAFRLVASWRKAEFQGFSAASSKWLTGEHTSWKLLALELFRYVVEDPDFSDLPLIFQALWESDVSEISKLRRAFIELLRTLIQRSEAESARFLLDILERDAPTGRKLIRGVMDCFQADQQGRLKLALST